MRPLITRILDRFYGGPYRPNRNDVDGSLHIRQEGEL